MSHDEVRVVVVDDCHDAALAMAGALSLNGYSCRIAHDGLEALELVEAYAPHCVMFDVDMPGLDGCEMSARLRERYGTEMVLIAVTGWSRDDRRVAETFDRVDHYLQKPIEADVIRSLLPPIDD